MTSHADLVDLYVSSDRLIGAQGDQRPEAQLMRALASDPPPRFLHVLGEAGAGKTSMIFRVLADLGRRTPETLPHPHEILLVNIGDDPSRLSSPVTFMHTMVQLIARQHHRFASVDPKTLMAAAADERTTTGPQVTHTGTLDAKFVSLSRCPSSTNTRPTMERARSQLGVDARRVGWVQADVRSHEFDRRYDLWHDRAVFHFMVRPADREGYLRVLRRTLSPGGHVVLATFGPDGPTSCSGLPVNRYSPAELLRHLGSEFEPISSRLHEHQTPAGAAQQFLYLMAHRRAEQ